MGSKIAILVGGGPAPGINGVIAAVTIEAVNRGGEVIGILEGYKHLAEGDVSQVRALGIAHVSRIHFQGGSILATSRENPAKDPERMGRVVESLRRLGVGSLVSIGGEDTATTAHRLHEACKGSIQIVHVPKTIDNDLPLPGNVSTFGFQTARHVGAQIVANLMEDSRTTRRWFFVVAMGRSAGHLTLGIAKAAGATLALIPEEFERGTPLDAVSACLEGAVIKRLAMDRNHGVAIIGEGVAEKLKRDDLVAAGETVRDEHGHVRLAEIGFAETLKRRVEKSFSERGMKVTITDKNIGYELRSAPPIPFDAEYTRNLGYAAVKFLADGGSGSMVSVWGGKMTPIPLSDLIDPATGHSRLRLVDMASESYEVGLSYMIRLRKQDFESAEMVQRLAGCARMDVEAFRARFASAAV